LFVTATEHELRGDYTYALLNYQEAMIYDSTSATLFLAAGKAYLRLGREESAMHTLRRCVALDPDQLEAHDLLARIYASQGWFLLVERTYQTILERDSTYLKAYYNLALLYLRNHEREKAVSIYQKILSLVDPSDPENLHLLLGLGELYLDLDKLEEAEGIYTRLVETDSGAGYGHYGLGLVREEQGDTALAIQNYLQALEQAPDIAQARERLSRLFESQARWDAARELLVEGIARDTTDLSLWLELGNFFRRQDDSTLTAQTYNKIIRRFPDRWEGYLNQGRFHLDRQAYEPAYRSFARVVELHPDNAWGWLFGGISLVHLDSLDSAVPALRKALAVMPEDPLGNYYLGSVLMQKRRYREAEFPLQTALGRRPGWISAMSALAAVWDGLKKHDASDSLYAAALAIEPDNALLLNNYAYSLSLRGVRLDEALAMAERAVEHDPENGAYLDTIGWIYFNLGDYEKALEYIEQAFRLRPDNPEVIDHLGDVYHRLGQTDKAIEFWEKALSLDGDNMEIRDKLEGIQSP